MASILVVCTGNVCRSPIAEGMLRAALLARMGEDAPRVRSAGTAAWEGSGAMPESVAAAAERGVDIRGHEARTMSTAMLEEADLVLGMATEHREEVARLVPAAAGRVFTLKELVRLLEALPPPGPGTTPTLAGRIALADDLRRKGFEGNPHDEDVKDPLGTPLETYRAIAWELKGWIDRLADLLIGVAPVRSAAGPSEG